VIFKKAHHWCFFEDHDTLMWCKGERGHEGPHGPWRPLEKLYTLIACRLCKGNVIPTSMVDGLCRGCKARLDA
jgi:hypothetical protein